jgi:hypothetical protein
MILLKMRPEGNADIKDQEEFTLEQRSLTTATDVLIGRGMWTQTRTWGECQAQTGIL